MADLGGAVVVSPIADERWDFLCKHLHRPAPDRMPLSELDQILNEKGRIEQLRTLESSIEEDPEDAVAGWVPSQSFMSQGPQQGKPLGPTNPISEEETNSFLGVINAGSNQVPRYTDPDHPSTPPSVDGYDLEYGRHSANDHGHYSAPVPAVDRVPFDPEFRYESAPPVDAHFPSDVLSVTSSQHEATISEELQQKWILNLSIHFRDGKDREKFFVTYREEENLWRRVTISLNYRDPPPNSLEMDVSAIREQSKKNAKIYAAIRDSLADIRFYDTVTNLLLETTDGQLHIHVMEDGHEIIKFPLVEEVEHLGCRRIKESEITFDFHVSGFVYKVFVAGQHLIKKEIPSPEVLEEFLYEINALAVLSHSKDVVRLYGIVVDDSDRYVKGLLISYAEQGNLGDIMFDIRESKGNGIPWPTKQRWARQIVTGLADIHESGFVQGDLTLSNIVVDAAGDAKIIDINRRGCPIGWEPPEIAQICHAGSRITLYIGVKSDLYQLGMVLWALATETENPDLYKPLMFEPQADVPEWYRRATEICLSADPRMRLAASTLLHMFPPDTDGNGDSTVNADDACYPGVYEAEYHQPNTPPYIITAEPSNEWQYSSKTYVDTSPGRDDSSDHVRGRSPPRSRPCERDECHSPGRVYSSTSQGSNRSARLSCSGANGDDATTDGNIHDFGRRPETPCSLGKPDVDSAACFPTDIRYEDLSPKRAAVPVMDSKPSLGDGLQMRPAPKLSRQDTIIYAPIATETRLAAESSEMDVEAVDRTLSGYADGLPAELEMATEALDVQTVSDMHETKTMGSDIDGGVSLDPEFCPSDNGLLLQCESHCPAEKDAQKIAQEDDKAMPSTPRSYPANPMPGHEAMTTSTTNRDGIVASASERLQPFPVYGSSEEVRLGDFLKGAMMPRSHLQQRSASLPHAISGIGAGLWPTSATMRLGEEVKMGSDFNTVARPATVQALMTTTD